MLLARLGLVADHLARWAPHMIANSEDQAEERMNLERMIYWLRAADNQSDSRHMIESTINVLRLGQWNEELGKYTSYKASFLLECLILTFGLRSAGTVRDSLIRAVRLLPPAWQSSLQHLLNSGGSGPMVASGPTISKARILVDVAFMMWYRSKIDKLLSDDLPPVFFALADSSPQGGKNWELCELSWIAGSRLDGCADSARKMFLNTVHSEEDSIRHETLMRAVSDAIEFHTLPPAALGPRQLGLEHKAHALVHALRLETSSWAATSRLASLVTGMCSDLGTEADLNRVVDINVADSFSYWQTLEFDGNDFDDAMGNGPAYAPSVVSFARSLLIPGTFHLVDNLSKVPVLIGNRPTMRSKSNPSPTVANSPIPPTHPPQHTAPPIP